MEEENLCRICWEPERDATNDPLISPCLCSGTQKYIHAMCLQTWRMMQPFRAHQCDVCHYVFQLSQEIDPRFEYWFVNGIFWLLLVGFWTLLALVFRTKQRPFSKAFLHVFTLMGIILFLCYWSLDYPFISGLFLLQGPISILTVGPFLVAIDGYIRGLPIVFDRFASIVSSWLHANQHVLNHV
jgi:hypothetical protein